MPGNREDNIKLDLKEMGWEDVEWIHCGQNRDKWRCLVKTATNVLVS
jgi:hypothetical protein